jgi:hypothetical protein
MTTLPCFKDTYPSSYGVITSVIFQTAQDMNGLLLFISSNLPNLCPYCIKYSHGDPITEIITWTQNAKTERYPLQEHTVELGYNVTKSFFVFINECCSKEYNVMAKGRN